jgi:hypothetical protein
MRANNSASHYAGCSKARVTVAEMAAIVGLSRSHFNQLIKELVFPSPVYDIRTRRPFYTAELQATCLRIRRSHCGANGKAVGFYAQRRKQTRSSAALKEESVGRKRQTIELLEDLRALGLKAVKMAEVEAVIREAYSNTTAGVDPNAVLQRVFVELKRSNKH